MKWKSGQKRGHSHKSSGRNSVWSRAHHRRGLGDPNALCKFIPLLCPPKSPNKQPTTPPSGTKDNNPDPDPFPPVKSTSQIQVPSSATAPSTTPAEVPTPISSSSTPPLPTTNTPTTTSTPSVTSATENNLSLVPSNTASTNSISSSEPFAAATQLSDSSSIPVSDSTSTVVSTEANGQLTTKEVVSTVPIPFTTSSGIPLVRTTNSLGSTFTVPYGPDPTFTSPIAGSEAGTNNTSPSVNGVAAKGSDNDIGAVVGGILGGIALIVLLILGFCFIRRHRRAIRTAPSAEFLGQQQYPFSGSTHFQFQRAGSFGSSGEVMDIGSPVRELGPDPFGAHNEKAESSY